MKRIYCERYHAPYGVTYYRMGRAAFGGHTVEIKVAITDSERLYGRYAAALKLRDARRTLTETAAAARRWWLFNVAAAALPATPTGE